MTDKIHDTIYGLTNFCCICGVALYHHEVVGEVNGRYIDYDKRTQGETSIVFCKGCWDKYVDIVQKELGVAILKRRELDGGGLAA